MKLLDRPNLIEADLQGFFNNVTHQGISIELSKIGFPPKEIEFIRKLNQSPVKLTKEDRIPEPHRSFNQLTKLDLGMFSKHPNKVNLFPMRMNLDK
jgi:hypothetical protein